MQQEPKHKRPAAEEVPLPQWDEEITEGILPARSGTASAPENIQELLLSLPDRDDLERLFEKNVTIAQIVQLLGRNLSRQDIQQLLGTDDVRAAVERLLSGAPGGPRQ